MSALYNEIEEYPCRWLENLIKTGDIASGDVERRSIEDLRFEDVAGYTQFHAFAGIGVWSRALRLAGWPDDAEVWTGSCPCQPFSIAGKQKGEDDDRHLFPSWLNLIEKCHPPVVFGEQVASPSGREWLDNVQSEMEALGYAVGTADICAASVGAPHIRSRLWFGAVRVAYPDLPRLQRRIEWGKRPAQRSSGQDRVGGGLGDADEERRKRRCGSGDKRSDEASSLPDSLDGIQGVQCVRVDGVDQGATQGFWGRPDWLLCRDAKVRPVEAGTFPLADGPATRVGRLRAYGNAIVPQVAAEFIQSFIEALK